MSLKLIPLYVLVVIIGYLALLSFLSRHGSIKPPAERSLQSCPDTPNCVFSGATDSRHKIPPMALLEGDAQRSWQRLIRAIRLNGGEILVDDGSYAHAVFTSTWFRFRDDLEISLAEGEIAIRSASRAGRSDLGKNRQRVERIRQLYLDGE